MPTQKKEQKVADLAELLQNSKSVILTDYRGLTMKDFNSVRAKLRPEKVYFHVIKNTLLRRAAEGSPLGDLTATLEGTTAAAFSLEDSVAGPRLLTEWIKESRNQQLMIKCGVIDGNPYSGEAVTQIAKLPPKNQMIAQLLGSLQSPITNLAGTMQSMISGLVWTLSGIAEQKS
ncbi:MAG: 50S ribosomal protein L10 [Armatimonadota bacterium]